MSSESFDWDGAYAGDGHDALEVDTQLLERVADLKPGEALDLGCGAGGNAIELAARGWDVVGVDVSPKAISSAIVHSQHRDVTVRFEVGDAETWTPPHEFDLVVSNFALPPAGRRAAALATMMDALAPGGTLVVADWDTSMHPRFVSAGFDLADFVTVDILASELSTLEIERAERIEVPAHEHEHGGEGADLEWVAVVVRARRAG